MDINSLLSPSESPRGNSTPSSEASVKKSRKQKSSHLAKPYHPSSSDHAPLPQSPTALSRSTTQHAHNAVPMPAMAPPSDNIHTGMMVTQSADSLRPSRQSNTPGMDALADLASMQHHVSAVPRPQGPPVLRGTSFERSNVDTSIQTPPPRQLAASSLPESEQQRVTQVTARLSTNPFDYQAHVQLINTLHQGFLNHVQSQRSSATPVNFRAYDLLQDLQNARGAMAARFALGEDLLADWVQDQVLLASSLEDRMSVMEFCQKVVDDETASSKLWLMYAEWVLSLYKRANPDDHRVADIGQPPSEDVWSDEEVLVAREAFTWQLLLSVWNKGAEAVSLRMNDSHLLWDPYTILMLQELGSSPSRDAVHHMHAHFRNRLQIPHATWDQTFQMYSNFVSTHDNTVYEVTMSKIVQDFRPAKIKYEHRDIKETALLRAIQSNDRDAEWRAFSDYIDFEHGQSRRKKFFDHDLLNALYQRATLRYPAKTELWEGYVMFLTEEITIHGMPKTIVLPALDQATRHCPWSGNLWEQYILAAEIAKLPFSNIGEIKHKATSTGLLEAGALEEVLKVHTGWCGFLRRRAFQEGASDEDIDVAEVGIRSAIEDMDTAGRSKYGKDYQGDPQFRLEKIYIKYLTQSRNWAMARDTFKKLIPRKGHNYDFWLRFYLWEMSTWCKLSYSEGDSHGGKSIPPTEATGVLLQALRRSDLDWPEKIIETFQFHCEDHEDAQELQSAIAQVWRATRAIKKRREQEAQMAYDAYQTSTVQQHSVQQANSTSMTDDGLAGKRKRDDGTSNGPSKRSRPEAVESIEPQVQEQQELPAASHLKRDRENATVMVRNLPPAVTQLKIRHFFQDCGTINSIKLTPEPNEESANATVEFETVADSLTAQTRDMKMLDGNQIEVSIGSVSTLYVCNFPPSADEAWIRDKFQQFGKIVDIRFPSLKYDTHRRFCYIEFKTPREARAATLVDGELEDGELKLVAKISDPAKKQKRHGALEEGREVFLLNLSWTANEDDVKQAFSRFGEIDSVRIPKKPNGSSKGIGFVAFNDKDAAMAALEMNHIMFRGRMLNVSISTNDASKRQDQRIVASAGTSQRASDSPVPNGNSNSGNAQRKQSSPAASSAKSHRAVDIRARTIALMNIPDTVNDARIRLLAEPYGKVVKISLRPDHGGAIVEFEDVASAGKANLGLEGKEIVAGRTLHIGTINEMKQQKGDYRNDKISSKSEPTSTGQILHASMPVRRPAQPGAKRGGRGGLGVKRAANRQQAEKTSKDSNGHETEINGTAEADGKSEPKSNADFRNLMLNR